MASPTLDDRRERLEKDDGDLNDTVYRMRRGGRGDICYHDDECSDLTTDDPVEMTRRECQRRVYPPCSRCVLNEPYGSSTEQQPSLRHSADDVDYEFEWDKDPDADAEEVA